MAVSKASFCCIFTNKVSNTPVAPIANNPETMMRSSNGNYLDNIIPDGPTQGVANFAGNVASSMIQP